jgi:aminopeptidase N
MSLNIAVSGATGLMGQSLARLIVESEDLRLVGGIARSSYEPVHTAPLGYDQIFVPEYNSGAMENVGLVTYNEAHLFRDPATENQRLDRDLTGIGV